MNQVKLGEAEALFAVLRQSADADVVAAIEALVRDAPDPALNRVNVLDFAAKRGLDQERVIASFLHAARVCLFDLSWNVRLSRLRRRARRQYFAQDRARRRVHLPTVRGWIRAHARRDGRSIVHGEPARSPDRRARSAQLADVGISATDFL